MIESGAAPPMVDALRRVRRCMSRRVFCGFVFGPFHYCTFCEHATPDAPETIGDQRRRTRCRYSDNLRRLARERIPTAPAKWLGPITPTVYTNYSTRTETKAFNALIIDRDRAIASGPLRRTHWLIDKLTNSHERYHDDPHHRHEHSGYLWNTRNAQIQAPRLKQPKRPQKPINSDTVQITRRLAANGKRECSSVLGTPVGAG